MVKVSAGTLTKYKNMAEAAHSRIARFREKGEKVMETATRTVIVTGTAFGLGVLQGKTGGAEVMGVPLDLIVGLGAHGGAFAKIAGSSSKRLHDVGDAALAVYASTMGRGIGNQWRTTGKFLGSGAKVAGELEEGTSGADGLTDQELAAAVMRR